MQIVAKTALLAILTVASHCLAQYATTVNDSPTAPAAPAGTVNVVPQNDGGHPTVNVSHYVLYPTVQVNCPPSGDLSSPVNNAMTVIAGTAGGVIDARRCNSATTWTNAITMSQANTVLLLPCATLTVTQPLTVPAGVRNVTIHGCSYQGGSASSGTYGGTVWNYQAGGNAFTIGDPTNATDTQGFALTDMAVTLPSAASNAVAIYFHRTQEIDIERVYFIGNNSTGQTAILLDGTGNYSGGTFVNVSLASFGYALEMTGVTTAGANASTFVRLHINCSTSAGAPITGTYGLAIDNGDGNTFIGGDVEGCDTALHLGGYGYNNTLVGVRNENSNHQVVADSGSQYNLWLTGGTMFTGQLTDNGTHNSFQDAFHRGFNQLNGDVWRAQADQTVTDTMDTGLGLGHVRGHTWEMVTDVPGSPGNYQNAWAWGAGDGTSGVQSWTIYDMLNNLPRFGADQNTAAGGNAGSYINGIGSGTVCVNCSPNSGTGGLVIGSGGSSPSTAAQIDGSGNTYTEGNLVYMATGSEAWRWECNSTGACQLRASSATVPFSPLIFYNNSGTEIDSQASAAVSVNNQTQSGTGGFIIYGGGATYYNTKLFAVTQSAGVGAYYMPGIAPATGTSCLQIASTGYLSNTGAACAAVTFFGTGNANIGGALPSSTTGSYNTAAGQGTLHVNSSGGSNTATGWYALYSNTTGSDNVAYGAQSLYVNTSGTFDTAIGNNALYANTTGNYNTAIGGQAGRYIADGSTANQTSGNSVYLGYGAYALASGDTNENVLGNTAIGHGSNTSTLGNTATIGTWLNGTQHLAATAPTASTGTVATYSTNAAGEITGLSAATAVTITFANSGWTNAAFCVANSSVTATQPYVTAISKTAVTFTSPALTGNLFYHCDGN